MFPSWEEVRSTGPRATREKVRYCTVVIGDLLLLLLLRWDLDMDPVWEFMLTVYMHPCDVHSSCNILDTMYSFINGHGSITMTPYLSIASKNKLTGMIIIHSCYFILKEKFVNNATGAKIDNLRHNLKHSKKGGGEYTERERERINKQINCDKRYKKKMTNWYGILKE